MHIATTTARMVVSSGGGGGMADCTICTSIGGLAESSISSEDDEDEDGEREDGRPWEDVVKSPAAAAADPFQMFSQYGGNNDIFLKDDFLRLVHRHDSSATDITDDDVTEDFSEAEDWTEEPSDLTEFDTINDDEDEDNMDHADHEDDDENDAHSVYADKFSNITLTFVRKDAPMSPQKVSTSKKNKKKSKHTKATTKATRTPMVRFASNPDGSVQCTRHEFEKVDACDKDNVWYTYAELDDIQESANALAQAFNQQHGEYGQAIAGLYYSYKKHVSADEIYDYLLQIIASQQQQLQQSSSLENEDADVALVVRGLEPQIASDVVFKVIKKHRKNVLKAQMQHRNAVAAACDDLTSTCKKGAAGAGGRVKTMTQSQQRRVLEKELKRVSKLTSRPGRQLAEKMAEYDTYEALAAIFS
jgi:hypothetical protein